MDGALSSAAASPMRSAAKRRALARTITYRYRDLISNGLPRFATYLRRHDEASRGSQEPLAAAAGSATKPIRVSPAFCTMPISSATRP